MRAPPRRADPSATPRPRCIRLRDSRAVQSMFFRFFGFFFGFFGFFLCFFRLFFGFFGFFLCVFSFFAY
jgi:hypothetical protein